MTESASTRLPASLHEAIAQIPVAIFVPGGASGRFQYVNDEFADLLNRTPASLTGDENTEGANVSDCVHPDDRLIVRKWFDLATDETTLDDVRFQRTNGHWTRLRVKLRCTKSTGDSSARILIGTADAIRETSGNELAFHRAFEKLIIRASARFVNAISDGVDYSVNKILEDVCRLVPLHQCHLVRVHDNKPPKLTITHEYRREDQACALGDFRFVPVHVVPWLYDQIDRPQNLMIRDIEELPEESGNVTKLLRGNNVHSYIIIPILDDGGRWGYLGLVPSESGGRVWNEDTLSLVRIVGELIYGWLNRAQKDEEIKQSQQQWSSIASAASDFLAIVASDGTIQDARFGSTDITGQSIYSVVTAKFRKQLRSHVKAILADPSHSTFRDFEYIGYSPEGKEIWYRGRLGSYLHDPSEVCVSLIATSIQAYKEADARSQALQSELEYATRLTLLGNMSVEVAHQFHQPLQVIESYIDGCRNLLKRDRASRSSLEKAFDGVSNAVRRASQIISQLQHFMKRQNPQLQATSINTIAENAIRLAEATIRKHNVDLQQQLTHGLPAINVDQLQITHVLLNLILNGIEAAAVGRFDNATLTIATSLQANDSIRVSVADNGSGIPEENISQIFEQFYTTKEDGLGLGLAQSRNIIETHHGRLWIESSDESGTELCLELPTVDFVGNDTAELEIPSAEQLAAYAKENAAAGRET
jgi:signal transduction histidine kinase